MRTDGGKVIWRLGKARVAYVCVLFVAGCVAASMSTAQGRADASVRATPSAVSNNGSEPLCTPGDNTNPLHVFRVTITCLVSLQAFKDPDLKIKDSCIAKVGFDTVTDLIPAGKVKLLEKEAPGIARSAKDFSGYLKLLKIDGGLISGLDKLGKAVVLVKGNPRETVELFITSDEGLASLSEKLRGHPSALKALTDLQGRMKSLFLGLTGIGDAKQCLAAFKSEPSPKPAAQVFVNCLPGGGGISPAPFKPEAAPSSCDLQFQPENLANLLPLRDMHWKNWGEPTTTGIGMLENTHPGQGGPAQTPITLTLSDIERGCDGKMFYTRELSRTVLPSCQSVPQPL